MNSPAPQARHSSSPALLVAGGIFLSRIFGLVRQRVLSHYLGLSATSDAFAAAFRIPNFLQNLLGEGVLSASFIPVYARLRAEGRDEDAERLAGAIFALLALVTSAVVLAGVLLAAPLTDLIAVGFSGPKRELTTRLVRILFPGAGLLVMSAWCLGVLNSHRRFFLSYVAPVVWNLAIIVAVIIAGEGGNLESAALAAALGSVAGSLLQFLVQLPTVFGLLTRFRPVLAPGSGHVHAVVRSFWPAFVGRGVVQLSAFVDTVLASLLGDGPLTAIQSAQTLYTLPVSLFGMAVSAAELPAMSAATGNPAEQVAYLRERLDSGLRRIAYFVVPSAVAFLAFGDVVAGAVFQTGRFTAEHSRYVWGILAGSAVGLLAATMGRLYSSTYYALRDTRTPLRFAVLRVLLNTCLGYLGALTLPGLLGLEPRWGAAALTASAGLSAWVEFTLLRRGLKPQLGPTGVPPRHLALLWGLGALAAGLAWLPRSLVTGAHPIARAAVVLGAFGLLYLSATALAGVAEARALLRRAGLG